MTKIQHNPKKDAICSVCNDIVNHSAHVCIGNPLDNKYYINICRICAKKILKATEEPEYYRAIIAIDKVHDKGHLLQWLNGLGIINRNLSEESIKNIENTEFSYPPGIYVGRFYLKDKRWDIETPMAHKITWDHLCTGDDM